MRPLKTLYGFFLIATLLALIGCGEKLPRPTQKGANTFGCKINGKNWVPDGLRGFGGVKPITGGFLQISSYPVPRRGVYILAISNDQQQVALYLNDYRTGTYPLDQDTQPRPANLSPQNYGYYRSADRKNEYITSSQHQGLIVITHSDTLTGIVSGTFEFTAGLTTDPAQKVRITKGRFDVKTQ